MRVKSQLILVLILSCLIAALGLLFLVYQDQKEKELKVEREIKSKKDLGYAEEALQSKKPLDALSYAKQHLDEIYSGSGLSKDWLELCIKASQELKDSRFLASIYDLYPEAFKDNEKACLDIAQEFIDTHRASDFFILKDRWQSKSQFPDRWTLLEADQLALAEKPDQAIALLNSRKMAPSEETERLVRLSLLSVKEHPAIAWQYLSEATRMQPKNPELRLYRVHLLVSANKEDLAITELKNLIKEHPSHALFKEELVDIYLRNKDITSVIEVLKESLVSSPDEELILKTLFLSKTQSPIDILSYVSQDQLSSASKTLLNLQEGQFWNASLDGLNKGREEFFWLSLIQALKENKEIYALQLIEDRQKPCIYSEPLKIALRQVLLFRNPSFISQEALEITHAAGNAPHPLFKILANPPYNPELDSFFSSDEIFPALFIASGWPEAAIQFHASQTEPLEHASWLSYGMTQAIAQNRDTSSALKFALKQKMTPQLAFLTADLYLKNHQDEKAKAILTPLSAFNNILGRKAAEKLARIYFNEGLFETAKDIIEGHPRLRRALKAQELLARIYLNLGDYASVEDIYEHILDASKEAKSYMAQKAFQEKNYPLAYSLTQELLRLEENNVEIKENLRKIAQAANQ